MNATDNVTALCRELSVVVDQYRQQLRDRAEAEAEFKRARAKRILRARAEGEASSAAAAETVADADDGIAGLRLRALITEGMAAATKEQINSLRERIGFGRSLLATEREMDKLHSQDRGVA